MERILVTGASGLLGAEVAAMAAAAGYEAIGLGNANLPAAGAVSMRLDLTGTDAPAALRSLGPLAGVAHCAAEIPPSFAEPQAGRAARINQQIDSCISEFCGSQGIRLVYCSTVAVYGKVAGAIVDESFPTQPTDAYAVGKLQAEHRVRETVRSHAILRLCAPYGPAQRQRTVLRIFVEQALAGEPLRYFGSGLRQQDFLHVRDGARAVLSALTRPRTGGVFNVCAGKPISMRDLAELVLREAGRPGCATASGSPDPQEEYRARFDAARAAAELGWQAQIPLAQGVRQMIEAARGLS